MGERDRDTGMRQRKTEKEIGAGERERERKVGRETGVGEREREPQRKIEREVWWERESKNRDRGGRQRDSHKKEKEIQG